MRLLTKAELIAKKTRNTNESISKNVAINDEISKKIKQLNLLKDEYKIKEEMLEIGFKGNCEKFNSEIKSLQNEIAILEARRNEFLKPMDSIIKRIKEDENIAKEKMAMIEKRELDISIKEKEISDNLRFITDEKTKIYERKAIIAKIEQDINNELKRIKDLNEQRLKEYADFEENVKERTSEIIKSEMENEEERNANKVIADNLKLQQAKIDKDRKHLESQIITFKQAYELSKRTKR